MIAGGTVNGFEVTVSFKGTDVLRRISSEASDREYVSRADKLMESPKFRIAFSTALAGIHGQDSGHARTLAEALKEHQASMWRENGELQWYWAEYFTYMRDHGGVGDSFQVGIKACSDHYFYSLVAVDSATGTGGAFVQAPFFESSAPPTDSSPSRTRGIIDTVIFLAEELEQLCDVGGEDGHQALVEFLRWFSVGLTCRILEIGDESLRICVTPTLLGPADPVLRLPNGKEVLMVSRNVRETSTLR